MVAARRVLIVEDEEILAGNLKSHLERASCDARVAPDGASAIGLVDDFSPQVVVLDYRLPDMTGFEVYDALQEVCEQARCILITGHPSNQVISGAYERGIEHILFKPFPLAELSKVVCSDAPLASRPADRRSKERHDFPMQLYDGSWLYADRRKAPDAGS
jgi:DNA-binding response OmpR family regulator